MWVQESKAVEYSCTGPLDDCRKKLKTTSSCTSKISSDTSKFFKSKIPCLKRHLYSYAYLLNNTIVLE